MRGVFAHGGAGGKSDVARRLVRRGPSARGVYTLGTPVIPLSARIDSRAPPNVAAEKPLARSLSIALGRVLLPDRDGTRSFG